MSIAASRLVLTCLALRIAPSAAALDGPLGARQGHASLRLAARSGAGQRPEEAHQLPLEVALEAQQAALELLEERVESLAARQRVLSAEEAEQEKRVARVSSLTGIAAAAASVPHGIGLMFSHLRMHTTQAPAPAPAPAPVPEDFSLADLPCSDSGSTCGIILQCAAVFWLLAAIAWIAWFFTLEGTCAEKAEVLGFGQSRDWSSPWLLSFLALAILGLVCLLAAVAMQDILCQASAALLLNLAGFCFIFLGDDPLTTKSLNARVGALNDENRRLQDIQKQLQDKRKDLDEVTRQISELKSSMEGEESSDLEDILYLLHTNFALSTVSTVVQHFFNSDLDGSGDISGLESVGFVMNLTLLWEMVPDRRLEYRFQQYVQHQGLTLYQLALILDTMIKGDPVACREQLLALINSKPQPQPRVVGSPGSAPAVLEESYDELKAGPDGLPKTVSFADEVQERCKNVRGRSSVRCFLRLVLVVTAVLAVLLLVASFMIGSYVSAVCAAAALAIVLGLNIFVDILDNLLQLRAEVVKLSVTNRKLSDDIDDIGRTVADLQKLKVGLEKFHAKFGSDIQAARTEIHKHGSLVKMSVASTIIAIFKDMTSRVGKDRVEPDMVREFADRLEKFFKNKHGFDLESVKAEILRREDEGIDAELLFRILGLGQPHHPR